jgi:hypothetical protein
MMHKVKFWLMVDHQGRAAVAFEREDLESAWDREHGALPYGARVVEFACRVAVTPDAVATVKIPATTAKATVTVK